ncbi:MULTISPECIES: bifunctional diaminohydroxyphosphoribosylaminopyrimidine deaminase/5-amino-6-(5-phosphoribosylamino)uracil reductase RibD [Duncaniella]|uniref:Riboflavin biosynthesis protein RibD n=1 Tax=Duncaniella dubosii TaxID=2518971 RepID=A0A4P7W3R3_9BACT|nr:MULTISPECIES: bifunctional diaminohydroxyphosphoribosylaminopyrimidine deaminase/5-amino-6-(5-phosphoribosylamino)uracil reductase RibD [Duncaniella]MBJ2189518.1 bifunctional diaminohydroxyphosphoribosylaminopyrimidine deaminase/5-amino-6-(5-phosphoribosylamino)uracil reductase RibD [Muribaculaceae bacterium]MCX4284782.1 bifunctional diaminohydroxyphosphoribosylaminopyrimidine deaminase/5-amino-6-(5-phosphoribosylamino)uracil reductase RibD [Duncaniella dubosii]QCD42669.1 bifunctional diamino
METDEKYMRRALELARHGELDASPNPMVGAVIVDTSGRIIGEGWHRRCGEGHAEVNAVASVKDRDLLKDATMYVTLEPCSHYGKTPPCADMIVENGIPRVVIGTLDPFAKVAGRGVAKLLDAGVEVMTGMLEKECRELNRKFMTAHSLQRPYITLKWAQSADGFIDGHISTPLNSMLVHKLRATHDAILIGSGTALADNPTLTTRFYAGKSPVKVVLDRRKRLPADLRLFSDGDVIVIDGEMTLAEAMHTLYNKGISSVLVEGGAQIMESFAKDNLWDEIRVEVSPEHIEGKIKAPSLPKTDTIPDIRVVDGHKIISYKK